MVIKGAVDSWRRSRQLSYNLYCTWVKNPVEIYEYQALPFDSEIREADRAAQIKDIEQWHKQASKEMANFDWSTVNKN